jgi:Holliday junction resolvase RusA-like endonuclease
MESDVQLPLIKEAAPLIVATEPFVVFELPGEPQAWERAGATIRWGHGRPFVHFYTPAAMKAYQEQIAWAAKVAMSRYRRKPTSQPVALIVHAFLPIPTSWTWRSKLAARSGCILPTGKPDFDNLGKNAADAIRGIVFTDDATVVDGRVIKRYSDTPALRVEVREFLPPV